MDETTQTASYQFWIWRQKLNAVLTMLSLVVNHTFSLEEFDYIKYGLTGSSDGEERWFDYQLGDLILRMAIDDSDSNIIHLSVKADRQHYDRINPVNATQSTLEFS